MSKKLLISFALSLFISGFAYAHKTTESNHFPFSDTLIEKKDSSDKPAPVLKDPKEGFKDLFIPATRQDGISMEQLNPQAISFIEDYIGKYGKTMDAIKISGKPYFDMMDDVLTLHGLPKELKYLAVIESYLKINARSWAGAVGPWQFMPATARNMGLKVGRKVDERKDMFKSTHAASRYLASLFAMYGDWLLVIAAYNGGPGKVNSAIQKSGSRDFWELQRFLPAESRNHVKKFIATHYIMEGSGGITTLTKNEAGSFLQADKSALEKTDIANTRSQAISGRYNSQVIARHLAMDIAAFNKLNPDFDNLIAAGSNYELRLPVEKMDIFLSRKFDILNESVQLLLNPNTVSKARTTVN